MAVISNTNLSSLIARLVNIPGDFVEIGVFRGATFKRLALQAQNLGRKAHAFDSFIGMDEPTAMDLGEYPKGKFDIGGVQKFKEILFQADIFESSYRLWPGYIPDCFKNFNEAVSFALVDVDHYVPTGISINWIWPRISVGGIMVLDDYFRDRQGLASKAIDEWLNQQNPVDVEVFGYIDTQLYIKKLNIQPNPFPGRRC